MNLDKQISELSEAIKRYTDNNSDRENIIKKTEFKITRDILETIENICCKYMDSLNEQSAKTALGILEFFKLNIQLGSKKSEYAQGICDAFDLVTCVSANTDCEFTRSICDDMAYDIISLAPESHAKWKEICKLQSEVIELNRWKKEAIKLNPELSKLNV